MQQFQNYKTIITKAVQIQHPTDQHNTVCYRPQCYSNCHINCTMSFSLNTKSPIWCLAFIRSRFHIWTESVCGSCNHPIADHRHSKSIWKTKDGVETVVDKVAEQKYKLAQQDNAQNEMTIIQLEQAVDVKGQDMAVAIAEVGTLTESYRQLSLSGSFAGQVEKSVRLLELTLEGMRANATDAKTIGMVEGNLNTMKDKLLVVEEAAAQAGTSVSKHDFSKLQTFVKKNTLRLITR